VAARKDRADWRADDLDVEDGAALRHVPGSDAVHLVGPVTDEQSVKQRPLLGRPQLSSRQPEEFLPAVAVEPERRVVDGKDSGGELVEDVRRKRDQIEQCLRARGDVHSKGHKFARDRSKKRRTRYSLFAPCVQILEPFGAPILLSRVQVCSGA
jgi:hypothetical protein